MINTAIKLVMPTINQFVEVELFEIGARYCSGEDIPNYVLEFDTGISQPILCEAPYLSGTKEDFIALAEHILEVVNNAI